MNIQTITPHLPLKGDGFKAIKPLQSATEKLVLGINFEVVTQKDYKGSVFNAYKATIGNETFYCFSLQDLKEQLSLHIFQNKEQSKIMEQAIEAFGTSS